MSSIQFLKKGLMLSALCVLSLSFSSCKKDVINLLAGETAIYKAEVTFSGDTEGYLKQVIMTGGKMKDGSGKEMPSTSLSQSVHGGNYQFSSSNVFETMEKQAAFIILVSASNGKEAAKDLKVKVVIYKNKTKIFEHEGTATSKMDYDLNKSFLGN